jgi:hypothetical protein
MREREEKRNVCIIKFSVYMQSSRRVLIPIVFCAQSHWKRKPFLKKLCPREFFAIFKDFLRIFLRTVLCAVKYFSVTIKLAFFRWIYVSYMYSDSFHNNKYIFLWVAEKMRQTKRETALSSSSSF